MTERIDPRVAHTRNLVLSAAADLLVSEGFSRITIESVAEKCGVARSTIYRNWSSRGQLLVEAFDRLLGPLNATDSGSLAGDLHAVANRYAHGLEREAWGEAFPSLVGAVGHDDVELSAALAGFVAERLRIVSTVFDRAVERGELSSTLDVDVATELFVAPFFFRRLVSQQSIDDQFIRTHVDLIRAAVLRTA